MSQGVALPHADPSQVNAIRAVYLHCKQMTTCIVIGSARKEGGMGEKGRNGGKNLVKQG